MRTLAFFCLSLTALGQQPPTAPCDFVGYDMSSNLAAVKTATTGYHRSLPIKLKPGDTVVIRQAEGDWTCGYLSARKGGEQGWVRSSDIRPVEFDPNPPLTAWVGTWVQGENRITIQGSKTPGKLDLEGEAYWHGIGNNVHSGEFSAEAIPSANKLHSEDDGCKIDIALIGKYLLAADNNMCGGANVRFWGVWRRHPPIILRRRPARQTR